MATVYFGTGYPPNGYPGNNGNWSDVTQWFADTGVAYESSYDPATPLGRLPNPATDTVFAAYQAILSGVGTYSGPIAVATFQDPNAIFTGPISRGNFWKGTFSGEFPVGSDATVYGGNFTNANLSNLRYLYVREDIDADPLLLPSNLSLLNLNQLSISRQINWTYPIYFPSSFPNGAYTYRSLSVQPGGITRQLPTFTLDISTSVTNVGSVNFFGQYDLDFDLNTVFTNPAPLIFGSPTQPARFQFAGMSTNREVTFYIGGGSSSVSSYSGVLQRYDKINIIQVPGYSSNTSVFVYSADIWAPTINVALTPVQTGTKNILSESNIPNSYGFGRMNGSKFEPIINLALSANLNAEI